MKSLVSMVPPVPLRWQGKTDRAQRQSSSALPGDPARVEALFHGNVAGWCALALTADKVRGAAGKGEDSVPMAAAMRKAANLAGGAGLLSSPFEWNFVHAFGRPRSGCSRWTGVENLRRHDRIAALDSRDQLLQGRFQTSEGPQPSPAHDIEVFDHELRHQQLIPRGFLACVHVAI